ncbi:MFS transporter [Streptomyces murinus]|uniref:MFS transporter n=1 Tax=Streptomyces murinus TaxID=33900 RepID=UPI001FC9704A|nr:MFS transporter [Streptomyces murinus]
MSAVNPRRWWALVELAAAQFMVIMNTSIIGVALPEMQKDLGFSQSELQWVFNAYVIAFGGLLLLGGRLSDLLGAHKVFITGWTVLVAGSIVAAAAQSASVEVVGRAVQGVGGALIAPSAMTLLMMLFAHDPKELGRAMALYGAAAPAGGTAGVFMGGVFTQWLSWPWVFIICIPIGLGTLAATKLLPAVGGRRGDGVDVLGAVSVTAGLALAVFAVVRAPETGWSSMGTVLELAGAVVLLALFLVIQKTVRGPLMPLGIWRVPRLGSANLAMALLGAALLPMTVLLMIFMAAITTRLLAKFGAKPLIGGGLLVLAAGLVWLAQVQPTGTFVVDVLPASLVAALGMSLAYIPAMMAAMSGAPQEQAGLASGIVTASSPTSRPRARTRYRHRDRGRPPDRRPPALPGRLRPSRRPARRGPRLPARPPVRQAGRRGRVPAVLRLPARGEGPYGGVHGAHHGDAGFPGPTSTEGPGRSHGGPVTFGRAT